MLRAEPRIDAFESFTFSGLPVVGTEVDQLLTNHVGGPSFKLNLHVSRELSRYQAGSYATGGYTQAHRQEIVRRIAGGETQVAVAASTGVPLATVGYWARKAKG